MIISAGDTLEKDDKQRLSYVYERYGRRMFSAAKQITQSNSDAEDALHNAFVRVAKRIKKLNLNDEDALCGYLFTVVKNEAATILRKRKNTLPIDDVEEVPDGYDPAFETERREIYEYATKIMTKMDDTYRAPLYLTVVMGYSAAETAKELGRNIATVRVQISRAKKMLADKLKEAGYELSSRNGNGYAR